MSAAQELIEMMLRQSAQLEYHGTLLREIKQELAPLRDLRDFVRRVAGDHERRLVALEKHTGMP